MAVAVTKIDALKQVRKEIVVYMHCLSHSEEITRMMIVGQLYSVHRTVYFVLSILPS